MNANAFNAVWGRIDALDISPTETLVLLALAASTNGSSGLCHPRQRKLVRKTHLALSTVKECLAGLKDRGLVDWKAKPAHVNEYRIAVGVADHVEADVGGAENHVDNDNSANRDDMNRARLLLAHAFVSLVPSVSDRLNVLKNYLKAIRAHAFADCDALFYELRSEIRRHRHDGEDIEKAILDRLNELPHVGAVAP